MSASRLLLGVSLTDRLLLSVGGKPALRCFSALQELLTERAPSAVDLFAEPVLDSEHGAPTRVSWYGPGGPEPLMLDQLTPEQRVTAEAALRERLAVLKPLLADPEPGSLLRPALTLLSRESILWAGDRPILVNWGMVPAPVGDTSGALARHVDAVIGPFLPPGAEVWPVPPIRPVPPEPGPSVAHPPSDGLPVPSGIGPRRRFVGVNMAAALAGFVIVASSIWLGAGLYRLANRPVVDLASRCANQADALHRIQEGLNDGLRQRIGRLEGASHGDVCLAAPGEASVGPTAPGYDAPPASPLLPWAPDQQPVQRPRQQPQAGQITNLAELLDASVVLVLAESSLPDKKERLFTGSGFVVAADRVVTNFHVVEDANAHGGRVFVTSRKLGRVVPAEIIAHTPGSVVSEADFALLRLTDSNLPSLSISTSVNALLPVVAVGFPGFITEVDDDFRRLLRGGGGALPDASFTSGEVSSIQEINAHSVVIHTAAINRGNSGGPLTDRCGRVIGVNTFMRIDQETAYRVAYALPAAALLDFLEQNGTIPHEEGEPCQPGEARGAAPDPNTAQPPEVPRPPASN